MEEMKFPVVFLDIDGVLNRKGEKEWLDAGCINYLGTLCCETGAKVVLVTTWKRGFNPEFNACSDRIKRLRRECSKAAIEIIDRTKDWFFNRGRGILKYLKEHPVDKWVILDDKLYGDYVGILADRLIITSPHEGLTWDNITEAKKILM